MTIVVDLGRKTRKQTNKHNEILAPAKCEVATSNGIESRCITVSIHCAPAMSEIDCIGRIESFWSKFVRGW